MPTNELREFKQACRLDNGEDTIEGLAHVFEFMRDDMSFWFARITLDSPIFQPQALLSLSLAGGRCGNCFFLSQKMSRDGATINSVCDVVGITKLSPTEDA